MLDIQNHTEFEFDDEILQKIAQKYSSKDVELLLIEDDDMRELNKNSRGIDKSTDVLSFPLEHMEHTPLGSIVINIDRINEASHKFFHAKDEELTLLFIHGLLHLLGYDHETDSGEMRKKEEEIIQEFNLPKSLIVRVEG